MYERAMPEAFGLAFERLAEVSGRTEPDIISETLALHGVEPTVEHVDRLARALVAAYESGRGELAARGRVLPGAREALAALSREKSVHQGVLTGNLRAVARVKLAVFALDRYVDLETSAYGDDHRDRAELVDIARARAWARVGVDFGGLRTVLIGDTRRDVEAASAAGARVIGVASGNTGADELREAGADEVLADLRDPQALKGLLIG